MDIEQLVRQELADGRHTPEGWAEPVQRVQAGVRRRRRRRYTMTLSATAVVIVLVGAALVRPLANDAPPAQTVFEWTAEPATLPELDRRDPRPDARPCTDDALGNQPWHERTGDTLTVLVANHRIERCTIPGTSAIIATEIATGVPVTLRGSLPLRHAFDQAPATIDPGEPARIDVQVESCPTPLYRDPRIVAGGREVPVDLGPGCGYSASPWYVQAPLINTPLTVTMSVPGTVRRGTTLVYDVTVRNAFPRAFSLQPCPAYQQTLAGLKSTYRLNCAAKSVPRHGALTFRMRFEVPASAALGRTTLTWMAVVADGRVAIADLSNGGVPVEIIE
ncbi:hypothetical protein ACFFX1_26080 [Dactylosporangium sucinum]|uniref:DUF4232 domain-containing protein n=1 Tax=Dactylosporangium sucinum TaxID=1424081 RepID=A0A917WK78_9ACTN|nr:hypothetical protein [Dactylosporangium sucinum]GGM12004.1 hypothetical protein GCM10007977_011460 [Dactylosporangium sucinum]